MPIPTRQEYLLPTAQHWRPFLPRISRRSRETEQSLLGMVLRLEVQPVLVWDEERNVAVALLGVKRWISMDGMVGELVWLTGTRMNEWTHLLGELERYLKETGCVDVRAICRPGWSRLLKRSGYRLTHTIMEKRL